MSHIDPSTPTKWTLCGFLHLNPFPPYSYYWSQTMQLESIVTKLSSLPPELVEEVLARLPLSAILDMASLRNANVNYCIQHSPAWKACWAGQLDTFIDLFEVCRGLWALWTVAPFRHFERWPISEHAFDRKLDYLLDLYADLRGLQSTPAGLLHRFYNTVLDQLAYIGRRHKFDVFQAAGVAGQGLLDYRDRLSVYTGTVEEAKKSLRILVGDHLKKNAQLSRQFSTLAELYARHPDYLKAKFDTSSIPRPNPRHIYHYLKHRAVIIKDKTLLGNKYAANRFSSSYAAVLPHDRCLQIYIQVLLSHPPKDTNNAVENRLAKLLGDLTQEDRQMFQDLCRFGYRWNQVALWDTAERSRKLAFAEETWVKPSTNCSCKCHSPGAKEVSIEPQPHEYPETVSSAMDRVQKGMYSTYAEKDSERQPRIYTGCCAENGFSLAPCDWSRAWVFWQDSPGAATRTRPKPLDEREIDWLRAFLHCVEYMEKTFPDICERVMADARDKWKAELQPFMGAHDCNAQGWRFTNRHLEARSQVPVKYRYESDLLAGYVPLAAEELGIKRYFKVHSES